MSCLGCGRVFEPSERGEDTCSVRCCRAYVLRESAKRRARVRGKSPLQVLREQVTGRIERGEADAIAEQREVRP